MACTRLKSYAYSTIGGSAVSYDEAGRQYFYDEHNRLIAVWAADDTVLANYTYDALGRRITFEDPVAVQLLDEACFHDLQGPSDDVPPGLAAVLEQLNSVG